MKGVSKRRAGELARAAMSLLGGSPAGLSVGELLQGMERSVELSDFEKSQNIYHGRRLFEDVIETAWVALRGAGWIDDHSGRWAITESGRWALERYPQPERFLEHTARRSLKGWAVINAPLAYLLLSRAKSQIDIEMKTVSRLGVLSLVKHVLGPRSWWQKTLPLQQPPRYELPDLKIASYAGLESYLDSTGLPYMNAGHTLYLPPESFRASAFGLAAGAYPADAGLKILKSRGGADGPYLFGGVRHRLISVWYNRLTYNRSLLLLVANALYSRGVGPRLYDLAEIDCGGRLWSAYVVAHVDGRVPTECESIEGIDRIRQLERDGLLKVTLAEGYDDEDFRPPDCNKNVLIDDANRFHYLDFQSFLLTGYQSYLESAGRQAAGESNQRSVVRGRRAAGSGQPSAVSGQQEAMTGRRAAAGLGRDQGRQGRGWRRRKGRGRKLSVCATPIYATPVSAALVDRLLSHLPEKAAVEGAACWAAIEELAGKQDFDVRGRLVLDFSSPMGMATAGLLGHGAAWSLVASENPDPRALEDFLLALGCTRFSVNARRGAGAAELIDLIRNDRVASAFDPLPPQGLSQLRPGCVVYWRRPRIGEPSNGDVRTAVAPVPELAAGLAGAGARSRSEAGERDAMLTAPLAALDWSCLIIDSAFSGQPCFEEPEGSAGPVGGARGGGGDWDWLGGDRVDSDWEDVTVVRLGSSRIAGAGTKITAYIRGGGMRRHNSSGIVRDVVAAGARV